MSSILIVKVNSKVPIVYGASEVLRERVDESIEEISMRLLTSYIHFEAHDVLQERVFVLGDIGGHVQSDQLPELVQRLDEQFRQVHGITTLAAREVPVQSF
jgi:predicted nucleotide-binding protein (sugar kinase/HSP70/actin superfamily)